MKLIKRIGCCALALALCAAAFGCSKKPDTISPDDITDDIEYAGLHTFPPQPTTYTPVYASAFGDTIILATVPVEEWHSQESDCPPREISNGGRVKCNGQHESEVPITQVIILEDLIPRVCSGWFRDMIHLENIQGLDKLHNHHKTCKGGHHCLFFSSRARQNLIQDRHNNANCRYFKDKINFHTYTKRIATAAPAHNPKV